jgi:hypothetical protein
MIENEIIERINKGEPFIGLSDIRLLGNVEVKPKGLDQSVRPDLAMSVEFNGVPITIYGEIKAQVTPMILKEIGPWLARLNSNNSNIWYVLICPFLSPESQKYCQENRVDFIDLCGNILIRIPGKVLIQRLNQPNLFKTPQLLRDPFGGSSSRVVRVLLNSPNREWSMTGIKEELGKESERQKWNDVFQLSISSVSKTIKSLEEELLIRRDGMKILIPDPRQLLFRWAEKYQARYQWMQRSFWAGKNPFGFDIKSSFSGLSAMFPDLSAVVTSSSAANIIAPFVNVDRIDVFIIPDLGSPDLRQLNNEQGIGPDFLFMPPYDTGVFMYAREIDSVRIASDIQIYLDCYARGGRDAKQAEYLLTNIIEKQWNKK